MSTLITGGAGFIGSHTSLKLLDSGENIIILDSLINSKTSVVSRIKTLLKIIFQILIVGLNFLKAI
tara:strand:+ start:57 stop:254 length:198 start_codon:yes stop_codon:yes gene_type:complete